MFGYRVAALVVLVLLACVVLCLSGQSEGYESAKDTIFVSVAAYRDKECSATVRDLFDKADRPERVFVGVCEQVSDDPDEACAPFKLPKNVRRVQIPYTEAQGPVYARYLCSTLYQGETWFMQVDSHTRFAKGWDSQAIANVKKCPSPNSILTNYPRGIEEANEQHDAVPVLCKSEFDHHGVPTLEAIIMERPKDDAPRPVPYVSGGFVFGPGKLVVDVPYDPNLPFLFQGEEVLHSARLWTAGYDFFTPLDNIAFHYYGRDGSPHFWDDIPEWGGTHDTTIGFVKRLLGLQGPAVQGYKYGMGGVRTLDEYWAFAGVDTARKVSTSEQKFCQGHQS